MSLLDPSIFTDLVVNVIVGVVSAGVALSPLGTKLKDLFKGIPSDLRTALNNLETEAASKLKAATAPAPVKLPASPAAAAVAAAAVTLAVPAAPAPAPVVLPAAAPVVLPPVV